jgi:acetoin utilization protein AcuB
MKIDKIMSKSIVTVEMDDSLKVVKKIFDNTHFHHLLVIESGRLYGVISDRDLLKALSPNIGTVGETTRDTATLNKKAHQIMTRKPVTLAANAGIYEAIKIFIEHNLSCIPVVDEKNKAVGIVSWRDILKFFYSERVDHPNNANQQGR